MPPPVWTVTASVKTTETSTTDPALYAPFAIDDDTEETVGTAVSTVAVTVLLASFGLPTASVNAPPTTETLIATVEFAVGVNVNV